MRAVPGFSSITSALASHVVVMIITDPCRCKGPAWPA